MQICGGGLVSRSALSGVMTAASTAAACSFLAAWSYWYDELDADCPAGRDCKCVLFGTGYASGVFVGGDRTACRYAFGSALASAGLAACNCAYYGFRALLCGGRRPSAPAPPDHRSRVGRRPQNHHRVHRTVQVPQDDCIRPYEPCCPQMTGLKVCSTILFAFMALNMFIASVVMSSGYVSTCLQYVHRVKSFLMVSGKMVELVTDRLSCGTVYDFLDYLQPPSRQESYELLHRHKTNPRDYMINTSALLVTSMGMSWLSTFLWVIFTAHIYYFR